jgi:hypothetical protein
MRALIAGLLLAATMAGAVEPSGNSGGTERSDRYQLIGAADLSFIHSNDDLDSWLYHGNGKLRYDEAHDGLRLNRIFIDFTGRLLPTLSGRFVASMNNDVAEAVDITDAYLEWRPVPRSAWRFRSRLGAFYPRLSLENIDAGWSSPYALSSSVINTWIGEELRTVGAEFRLLRDLPGLPEQQIALEGAGFYFNDPTGASLTWRGWAAHDRQTGVFGSIPMPDISTIEPWDASGQPVRNYEPYKEIDHRPGFYAGAQWRWGERAMVKGFVYNNRADPEARSGDEYAWRTRFKHVGAQFALPLGVGLLGQWIDGTTVMGPDLGPWHVQDVLFDSTYAMLTRRFGSQRISLRYEWFDLQPYNDPPGITNQDKGNAVALAWMYQFTPAFRFGAEYLQIASDHCKQDVCFWVFNGLPQKTRESQVQLSVRWQFFGVEE